MQNSMLMFTFSAFDWKHLFRANLIQKMKTVSLNKNLVSRLIPICSIQWWCSLFSVLVEKHPFWVNLVQKLKVVSLSWNMVSRSIRICRVQWCCTLSVIDRKHPFPTVSAVVASCCPTRLFNFVAVSASVDCFWAAS